MYVHTLQCICNDDSMDDYDDDDDEKMILNTDIFNPTFNQK